MSEEDVTQQSTTTPYTEVKFTDKKVIEVVKNMIKKTPIPGPGDELYNDLYKVLVQNLASDLRKTNTNDLEAEVTARKLAAWVLTFDEEIKNVALKNGKEGEAPLPSNPYYYKPENDDINYKQDGNVKLYNLSEHHSRPYWQAPGEIVELKDQEGSQIYVKEIEEEEGKQKTLVKKIKTTNKGKEVSSWVVEVANKEQVKSVEENIRLCTGMIEKPANLKLTSAGTIDEWKTVADVRRNEAMRWKNMLGCEDGNEETSGSTSKSTDRRKFAEIGQLKRYKPRATTATSKKQFIEVTDLERSLRDFHNVNRSMSPEEKIYRINEMKKNSGRSNVKDKGWEKVLYSPASRKIRSK